MFLPTTPRGVASSTLRSWAPRRASASSEISTPGRDRAAEVGAALVDDVEDRRGAVHVDDDRRPAVQLGHREGVDDAVGADLRGLSVWIGTPVLTPGPTIETGAFA